MRASSSKVKGSSSSGNGATSAAAAAAAAACGQVRLGLSEVPWRRSNNSHKSSGGYGVSANATAPQAAAAAASGSSGSYRLPQAAAAALPKGAFEEETAEPYEDECTSESSETGLGANSAAATHDDSRNAHSMFAAAAGSSVAAMQATSAAAASECSYTRQELHDPSSENFSLKPHMPGSSSSSDGRGEEAPGSSSTSDVNFALAHMTSSSSSSSIMYGNGVDTPHLSLPSPHGSYMSYHHQKLSGHYGDSSTDDDTDDSPCSFAEQQALMQQHYQQQQQHEDDPFGTFHFRLPPIRTKSNPNSAIQTASGPASQAPQPEPAQLLRASNGGGAAAAAAAAAESDRLAAAAAATVRASKPLSRAGSIVASVASTLSRITSGRSVSAGGALKSGGMYGQPQQPAEETTLLNPLFSPHSHCSNQSSPGQLCSRSSTAAAAAAARSFAGSRPDQALRHRLSQSTAWLGTTSTCAAGGTHVITGSTHLTTGSTGNTSDDGQSPSSAATIKASRSRTGSNAGALWMAVSNSDKDSIACGIMQQQEKAYLAGAIPAAPGTAAYMAAASAGGLLSVFLCISTFFYAPFRVIFFHWPCS
jgi:hypothetical protein